MECTVLSRVGQTQLLPRSHSQTNHDRAMVQTVINQHNIPSAEECFMLGIGMLLPSWLLWLLSPWVFSAKHSQWTNSDSQVSVSDSAIGGWSWESSLREQTRRTRQTEMGNQVSSFLLKSRSFELTRSQTTHPYLAVQSRVNAAGGEGDCCRLRSLWALYLNNIIINNI